MVRPGVNSKGKKLQNARVKDKNTKKKKKKKKEKNAFLAKNGQIWNFGNVKCRIQNQ